MGTIQVFACENIFVSPENVWSEIVDSNRWQWNPAIFYIKPITPMGSNNEGELTLNNEVEIGFRDATAPRYVRAKITRLVPYEQIVFVWSEVANIIQGGALHMAIEVVGVSQVKFTTVLYYSGLWSWMTQTDFEETQTRDLEAMCTALKTRLESRYKRDTKSTYENANGVVLGLSPPRWRRNGARCQQCKCTLAQIALMAIGSGLMARHHCRHCGGAFCGDCCKKTHTVPSWYDLRLVLITVAPEACVSTRLR
jgi:hypothetical protein